MSAAGRPRGARRFAAGAAALLLLLALAAFPVSVRAAETEIYSIDISVELDEFGDAVITEVWDVNAIADMTEWYLARYNLDASEIWNLAVWDETGLAYEYMDNWDVDGDIDDKAGKCGIYWTDQGPELCWGIGSFGRHVFTVRYQMSSMVKQYNDAQAIYQQFVQPNLSSAPQHVRLTIALPGVELTSDNTGVWAFGHEGASYDVREGMVYFETNGALYSSDYVVLLVEFSDGMFAPAFSYSEDFGSLLERAKEGSDYGSDYDGDSGGLSNFLPALIGAGIFALLFAMVASLAKSSGTMGQMKPEYKDPPYSRSLPWQGSLIATYKRLSDLRKMPNDGALIGAYLLRWIRSRQVELVPSPKKADSWGIKLYDARPGMATEERRLYGMLTAAAGSDWILDEKEFKKWSEKNYDDVKGWLEQCKNLGAEFMRGIDAVTTVENKRFFKLITTRDSVLTPLGEGMTVEMFGFKKYLEEFTIINERQAREVQLWDEYLVFAQIFGIADTVAGQFKQLYPDYFRQVATDLGYDRYGGVDAFDVLIITRMANSYGRAMYDGYRAGYNAHVSRDSGGGGFSSGGGGGGSSGGGSGGGGR